MQVDSGVLDRDGRANLSTSISCQLARLAGRFRCGRQAVAKILAQSGWETASWEAVCCHAALLAHLSSSKRCSWISSTTGDGAPSATSHICQGKNGRWG